GCREGGGAAEEGGDQHDPPAFAERADRPCHAHAARRCGHGLHTRSLRTPSTVMEWPVPGWETLSARSSLYEVTATPARNQARYPYCVMRATVANAGICAASATAAGVARPRSTPSTHVTMATTSAASGRMPKRSPV